MGWDGMGWGSLFDRRALEVKHGTRGTHHTHAIEARDDRRRQGPGVSEVNQSLAVLPRCMFEACLITSSYDVGYGIAVSGNCHRVHLA